MWPLNTKACCNECNNGGCCCCLYLLEMHCEQLKHMHLAIFIWRVVGKRQGFYLDFCYLKRCTLHCLRAQSIALPCISRLKQMMKHRRTPPFGSRVLTHINNKHFLLLGVFQFLSLSFFFLFLAHDGWIRIDRIGGSHPVPGIRRDTKQRQLQPGGISSDIDDWRRCSTDKVCNYQQQQQ